MTTFIKRTVCAVCDDLRMETETGAHYCRATPHGDCECVRALTQDRIESRLAQIAGLIAAETNDRLRSEEAEQVAGAYAEVFDDLGARLDEAAFMRSCNASASCARCRTRELADEYHSGCMECGLGAVA